MHTAYQKDTKKTHRLVDIDLSLQLQLIGMCVNENVWIFLTLTFISPNNL